MSQAIILGAAVLAGLACPVHMWWSHRRGRQAACCTAARRIDHPGELELLRAREERLSLMIAAHEATLDASAEADQAPAHSPRR